MDIEKLIERLRNNNIENNCHDCALGYYAFEAATALEQLQAENDRLKELLACYCDMCIEEDGVLWCQSCNEKCDYCIHPKEE